MRIEASDVTRFVVVLAILTALDWVFFLTAGYPLNVIGSLMATTAYTFICAFERRLRNED